LAVRLVRGVAEEVKHERLRLALVAGRREKAARALREALRDAGLEGHPGAVVLYDPDTFAYLRKFHDLLGEADALWSKPSELTFFAALGLPFVCAPPVGVHEERNRRWAEEQGALLRQHDPGTAGGWLREWIEAAPSRERPGRDICICPRSACTRSPTRWSRASSWTWQRSTTTFPRI
jgi:hypothetical protein